jgi:outer membrane biosynthesis protein TonB
MKPNQTLSLAVQPRLPLIFGLALLVLMAVTVYLVKDDFSKPPQTKKHVQQLTLIQTVVTPPPPVEKPAELTPEVQEQQMAETEIQPEPEPSPEKAEEPALGQLGLDADGEAGNDGFGLAANKGGRSLFGGGGGNAVIWYGAQIKDHLEEALRTLLADTPAMHTAYEVYINVWVAADGSISRCELVGGSGKPDIDKALRSALSQLHADIGKPPLENMPQPIKIRFNSRV